MNARRNGANFFRLFHPFFFQPKKTTRAPRECALTSSPVLASIEELAQKRNAEEEAKEERRKAKQRKQNQERKTMFEKKMEKVLATVVDDKQKHQMIQEVKKQMGEVFEDVQDTFDEKEENAARKKKETAEKRKMDAFQRNEDPSTPKQARAGGLTIAEQRALAGQIDSQMAGTSTGDVATPQGRQIQAASNLRMTPTMGQASVSDDNTSACHL